MPTADPGDSGSRVSPLADRVAAQLNPLGGRASLAAQRLATPRTSIPVRVGAGNSNADARDSSGPVTIRPDDVFPAASLATIPIALELLRRTDFGQIDLAERLDTSSAPRAGGSGVLDYLDPATLLTAGDLCYLMIGVNDHTAANFLLDLLGMGEVNETLSRLDLPHTRLARRFMDFEARAAHRDNVTSAADMVTLLSLVRGNALPGGVRLREFLAGQQLDKDLKALLPDSAQLAHKTGSLDELVHDCGILTGPGGACVYCVLTAEQSDVPATRGAIAGILRELWNEWCDDDAPDGTSPQER